MARIAQFITAIFLIAGTNHGIAAPDSAVKVEWGYQGAEGPAKWGQLNEDFSLCAVGRWQSPINIPAKVETAAYQLKISYHPAPMVAARNGSEKLRLGKKQTIVTKDFGVQINFPEMEKNTTMFPIDDHLNVRGVNHQHAPSQDEKLVQLKLRRDTSKEILTYANKDYRLVQFHFHSPSETLVRNRSYPLEIHLVHENQDGEILVLAVFVNAGEGNGVLQTIIDNMPRNTGRQYEMKNKRINPNDLMPLKKDYFSFQGSLTTPPCSEGLQWLVLAEPITASPAQIQQLRIAASGTNARPVQPMHHRPVYFAKELSA